MSIQIPKEIIQAHQNNNLIIFAGSGLSKAFGLPNWTELIEASISHIIETTGESRLESIKNGVSTGVIPPINALEILEIQGMKKHCLEFLSANLKIEKTANFELHRLIFEACPKIITTNYDHAFELAIGDELSVVSNRSELKLANIPKSENFLLKLHGDIDDPDKCIFFKSDYENFYGDQNQAVFERLKSIIADKTILFIGYSASDPFISQLFDQIQKIYNGYASTHFLITADKTFKHNYLQTIHVENYGDDVLNIFSSLTSSHTSISKRTILPAQPIEPKIKSIGDIIVHILYPEPIDKNYQFKIELIQKCFQTYAVKLNHNYLSINSIRDVEEGYIFIISKTVKESIIIEDEYLKSKQVSLQELLVELTPNVDGVFVITDNSTFVTNELNLIHPISIFNTQIETDSKLKNVLSSINHKLFKLNKVECEHTYNAELYKFHTHTKGQFVPVTKNSVITKNIDTKLLNNFIGRKTDVESIIRKMLDLEFQNKILTIKGAGGIGKTTTVSKAAIELAKRNFFKELHFIACQSVNTYENFEYQISKCFGLDSSVELKDQISAKHTVKEILIILDNFETLQNIEDHSKIISLVSFLCDYALIVTTTRQILNLDFEDIYELRNMTSFEGLELFKAYFKGKVEEKDEKFVRQDIVDELLNSNPLAIKLIAKGTPSQKNLIALRDELREDIFRNDEIEKIFESPEDINIEKSKSLYYSIKYSYDKLNEREKLAFELISLFPDGIHFEHFKIFTKQNSTKNQIGDADIKSLDDKSLLESNNGQVKLQSIVNRFSYFHFQKRDYEMQKKYYTECYNYNSFFLSLFKNRKYYSSHAAAVVHDSHLNNYVKCIEFLHKVQEEDKFLLLDFIDDVAVVFKQINRHKDIINVMKSQMELFEDLKNGKLALSLIILNIEYWTREFDDTFEELSKLVSFKDISKYLKSKKDPNYSIADRIVFNRSMSVYEWEGNSVEIIKLLVEANYVSYSMHEYLYKIGMLRLASELEKVDEEKDFFSYEVQLANGQLSAETLNRYLKSLYKKDSLEIIQTNYTLLKLSDFKIKIDTSKFVVTNPYSKGMILLISAIQETSYQKKITLFKKSIRQLEHIKYFYLEAKLQFARFLKTIEHEEFDELAKLGHSQCKTYGYLYLMHCFECLIENKHDLYDESNNLGKLGIDKSQFASFTSSYKKYWLKQNK